MNLKDEIRGVISVDIDEALLADKLFDGAVDPLMQKLLDLIPTEIDNAFYEGKKDELKMLFKALVIEHVSKVEDAVDGVLDEKAEPSEA